MQTLIMQEGYRTARLLLDRLTADDNSFVKELVNTPGWLRFIGDRQVHTPDDAAKYIEKIMSNPAIIYWIVRLSESREPVGVVTFIQRDYLDHPDIGFAFLPQHAGKGYAHEAAQVVLDAALADPAYPQVLATTLKDNTSSIRLLEKLGLRWKEEISRDGELLSVYEISRQSH